MRLLIAVIILFLFNSTSGFAETHKESASAHPIVLGYYPSWRCGVLPPEINYRYFTHICHAFITADDNGGIKTEGNLPSKELTGLAHKFGVKVLLSVGGMDSGVYLSKIMKNPQATDKFTSAVINMMSENNYDGIDIDWEFPKDEADMANFSALSKSLKTAAKQKNPDSLLITAVSGVDWAGKWIDAKVADEAFDFICVMTYDQHGPWSSHAGYNSSLYPSENDKAECENNCAKAQMEYWSNTKKIPKQKLIMGLACYGRGFAAQGWGETITYNDKVSYPYIPYKDIRNLLDTGWARHWDDAAKVPYLTKKGIKEIITYDDEKSILIKTEWAEKNGYRGVFFWEISQDFSGGDNLLVKKSSEIFIPR